MRKNVVLLVVAFSLILAAPLARAGDYTIDPVLKEKLPGYFAEDEEYYYLYASQEPGGFTVIDPYGTEIIKIPKEAVGVTLEASALSGGLDPQRALESLTGEDASYYYFKAKVDDNGLLVVAVDGEFEIKVLKSAVRGWFR
jgi:hypothetical protein